MKKVCMITQDAPHIDRRILLQAKSLIENGYSVDILYPFGEANSDFADVGINYIPIHKKINIKNTLSYTKKILRVALPQKIYEGLKEKYFLLAKNDFIDYEGELKELSVNKDYDIYVAHDLPALPIASYAAKEKSAKLVYDAHEFFTGQIALRGKRKDFFKKVEKELIGNVDLMFTVNDDIAELFKKEYNIENIHILLNLIEERIIKKVDLHKLLHISNKKKILLYQGGFLEDRNLEILVESAQFFDEDIVLLMLGYSFLEQKLKNIALSKNIMDKKVFFLDRVPQKELLDYTAGADAGIIPYPAIDLNTIYCTPNKLFEFLTANIPIIANKELVTVGNIFREHKVGNLISFESPDEIARGISKALEIIDTDANQTAIEETSKHFSWKNQESILIEAYKNL